MKTMVNLGVALCLAGCVAAPALAGDYDWKRRDAATGTVFYDCVTEACSRDALLSCHVQAANRFSTLDQYQRWRAKQFDALRANGADVEVGRAVQARIGPWVFFQDEYVVAARTGGSKTWIRSGFLVSEVLSISLVSSANDAATANRNFIDFSAQVGANSFTGSRASCTPAKKSNRPAE